MNSKNSRKRLLPSLLLSLFAAAAAPDANAQFSGVYVFGDSLSDAGHYRGFLAAAGVPAALVPIMGRYTTNPGPVWSEIISQYYGVTPGPSNASGGNIFAQGGSRIDSLPGVNIPPGQTSRPISTQVTEFLARGAVDPGALYAMWGGANDVFYNLAAFSGGAITQAQLQTNVLAAATAEIGQIGRLRAAGAQYILVFGLPNIGGAPAFAGTPTSGAVSALSAGYNTTLFTGLRGLGINVIPVDTFALFNEIVASPAAFGLTNTTGMACGAFPPVTTPATANSLFCYTGNLVAPNADRTYAFADSVHPTTASHAILADFVKSLIEGPSQYGLLAEGAVQARESHIRSISDGIAQGRQKSAGKWGVFFGGDQTNFDVDFATAAPSLETSSRAGTIGVTLRASDSVVLGAAYGHSRNRGTFNDNLGDYKLGEHVFSAFAGLRMGGFHGAAMASIGDLELGGVKRHVRLGTALRTAESNTEGTNSSFYLTAGYDFAIGRFTIGPVVSLTTQNVSINALEESGAGVANLRINEQSRKSEVWSLGARASMTFGNWTPWVRITADEEQRDNMRNISAMPISMAATGSSYEVPTFRPDSSYLTWSVGVTGMITPDIGLSAGYYQVDSRNGIKQDGWNGLISFHF